MSKRQIFAIDRLGNFLEELKEQDTAPEKEITELYINEINVVLESLKGGASASKHTVPEDLCRLADIAYSFAEIYKGKLLDCKNSLRFIELELSIAEQYKLSGEGGLKRKAWEIYLDISSQYLDINKDAEALENAKRALDLLQEAQADPDPKQLSSVYSGIAYAYQGSAPSKAVSYFKKSSDVLEERSAVEETYSNRMLIAFNCINIAIIMSRTGNYNDSVKQAKECLELLEEAAYRFGEDANIVKYMAYIHAICANAYCSLEIYELSEKSIEEGIDLCVKIKEAAFSDYCEIMDILYSTQSRILCKKGKYYEAIESLYKLLGIRSDYSDNFKQKLKMSDIYVDISVVLSKYLDEQGMAAEAAKLSLSKLRPYEDSGLLESSAYALSVYRRSLINLADVYLSAEMCNSAVFSYKKALESVVTKQGLKSKNISLIYSHAYILYKCALFEIDNRNKSQGVDLLACAYKSVCSIKKYGGICEELYNAIFTIFEKYEKKFK